MQDLLSIIIPVYKVEKYLPRCVDSVLNQSYSNLEIILVDDGSPDGCPEICDDYCGKDARIRVLHKENGGLSDARNRGIEIARGKYIGFVDSDDYIHQDMYMNLWMNIKREEADIAVCGICKVYGEKPAGDISFENEAAVYTGRGAVKNIFDAKLYLSSVVAWNKLYKRELFHAVRYPEGKIHEDEFTTYKLFWESAKVVYISGKYYYYYQRDDSIMGQRKVEFSADILEAYEQMNEYFTNAGEWDIVQLIKYRYMCLLKKYAVQLKKAGEYSLSDKLENIYKTEYKKNIRLIKGIKRKIRLWMYRWFKINF